MTKPPSNQRLRILFVPQWYPSRIASQQVSGVFCREHVRAASRYDDVAVLVYTARRQRWPTLTWERADDQGIPTFYATYGHSPIPRTTSPFFHIHLRRAIRRAIREWGRPDVIHTQDAYAFPVIEAAEALKTPFVISQHWSAFVNRELDRTAVCRFRSAFARAARVLPANRFAEVDYEHYGLQAKVTWLPNALDTETFGPPADAQREPWLLHASGLNAEKRVWDILRAFAQVRAVRPEVVLQVAGDGESRPAIEAWTARELPSGSVHFHGFLPKPDLAHLMHRACGFVLPSEFETFGCVLMEAMACGCPVLTTRVGGVPAVVREGDGIFAEVGNVEQIAMGMLQMLDGTHGIDMGRVSRETRARFSYDAVGSILHTVHCSAALGTEEPS
jgi:L-malate glycosyltransferase